MELKEYLKKNNISVTFFAFKLDYTLSHINKVVNKKQKPSEKLKRHIIRATKGEVNFE
jgi:hypothetical protein